MDKSDSKTKFKKKPLLGPAIFEFFIIIYNVVKLSLCLPQWKLSVFNSIPDKPMDYANFIFQ